MFFFGHRLIGMEFRDDLPTLTLPETHPDPGERGRLSGRAWAFGYVAVSGADRDDRAFSGRQHGRTMAGLKPAVRA